MSLQRLGLGGMLHSACRAPPLAVPTARRIMIRVAAARNVGPGSSGGAKHITVRGRDGTALQFVISDDRDVDRCLRNVLGCRGGGLRDDKTGVVMFNASGLEDGGSYEAMAPAGVPRDVTLTFPPLPDGTARRPRTFVSLRQGELDRILSRGRFLGVVDPNGGTEVLMRQCSLLKDGCTYNLVGWDE